MENAGFEMSAVDDPDGGRVKSSEARKRTKGGPDTKLDVVSEPNGNVDKKALPDEVTSDDEDDNLDGGQGNFVGKIVDGGRMAIVNGIRRYKRGFSIGLLIAVILGYNAYLIAAIRYNVVNIERIEWCNDVGFLIIVTAIVYWSFLYYFVLKKYLGKPVSRALKPLQRKISQSKWVSPVVGVLILIGIVTYVIIDAGGKTQRLISLGGIVVIVGVGLLLSRHPGRVVWSQVFWGLGLQFVLGLLILKWETGRDTFDCLSNKVKTFLDFTDKGSEFVYGYLATNFNTTTDASSILLPRPFAFGALPVIFFFSFFIAILYHFGAMMWLISKLGWFLQITVGTTAAESMNAAANIFVGQTEAPILIKPFLGVMTKSELHAVMTGGFATIAGTVLGAYISFGIKPSYLLSASIMAAPAALGMSKLIYPETKKSKTTADQLKSISLKTTDGNALDAASQGASQGVMLIGNILANLVAFIAFVEFLNVSLTWFGGLVGFEELSFEWILAKVFIPFAYVIGVQSDETQDVALLFGLKTTVNEFVAYQRLQSSEMAHLSERSKAIATYALCSFANFSSIGIQLGGLGFMAPERRKELSSVIWFAFIAGTACGLLNACIAGALLDE